tara:strand:+ start:1596 stop:1826 length:231 start_codon:yes stop_codon:yes gene_type:complete
MSNEPHVIGRYINGISINGLEFVLDKEDGDVRVFPNKEDAMEFLIQSGMTGEELDNLDKYGMEVDPAWVHLDGYNN